MSSVSIDSSDDDCHTDRAKKKTEQRLHDANKRSGLVQFSGNSDTFKSVGCDVGSTSAFVVVPSSASTAADDVQSTARSTKKVERGLVHAPKIDCCQTL